ncbi:hypothetical protein STEG23_011536, partial [Scotinomys teguina]
MIKFYMGLNSDTWKKEKNRVFIETPSGGAKDLPPAQPNADYLRHLHSGPRSNHPLYGDLLSKATRNLKTGSHTNGNNKPNEGLPESQSMKKTSAINGLAFSMKTPPRKKSLSFFVFSGE